MTEKRASSKVRQTKERELRASLFTQVALKILESRPLFPIKSNHEGPQLNASFVDEVRLISEGILNAAKTFGEE